MSKKMYVTKPFVFSHPGTAQLTNPVDGKVTPATTGYQKEFAVGEQEMTPEMENHPWILDGADGAIETDEQREDRLAQEEADKIAAEAQAKAATAKTARAQARQEAQTKKQEQDEEAVASKKAPASPVKK